MAAWVWLLRKSYPKTICSKINISKLANFRWSFEFPTTSLASSGIPTSPRSWLEDAQTASWSSGILLNTTTIWLTTPALGTTMFSSPVRRTRCIFTWGNLHQLGEWYLSIIDFENLFLGWIYPVATLECGVLKGVLPSRIRGGSEMVTSKCLGELTPIEPWSNLGIWCPVVEFMKYRWNWKARSSRDCKNTQGIKISGIGSGSELPDRVGSGIGPYLRSKKYVNAWMQR